MKHKSKTILLVEDQIIQAAPAIKNLKKAGYNVLYVMRGEDAVIMIESGVPVELIIMDIELGSGICGIATSEIINSITKIPILFFTSQAKQEIKDRIPDNFSLNYLWAVPITL